MSPIPPAFAVAILLAAPAAASAAPASAAAPRPNVLIIVADDLGYSDLGAYGSEIATPNIDRLAERGLRFTDFEANLLCTPSRVNLLTSVDNHIAGYGNMRGDTHPLQIGHPGYEEVLNNRVATIAEVMRDAGYRTLITGKWDLGPLFETGPDRRGFQRSYVLMQGAADHFQPLPALEEVPTPFYREDGWPVALPPDHYSSTTYASKLLEYLKDGEASGQPFFAVLAFTAPHWPLQAPDAYIEHYRGQYRDGYTPVQQQRLLRMKAIGLVPESLAAAPIADVWPDWQTLSPQLQDLESRRMQVYAAMVEALDHEVGRVLAYLEQSDQLGRTIVLFVSDNGAAADQPLNWGWYPWAERLFDLRPENMGRRGSYVWYGPGWAHVSSTPWRLGKGFPTNGGLRVPAIVVAPGRTHAGTVSHVRVTMKDVMPTLLELTSVAPPAATFHGRVVAPVEGRSFVSVLDNPRHQLHSADEAMGFEIWNRRAIIQGDWKIVWMNQPWGRGFGQWSLYNLRLDPTEQTDLAGREPKKLSQMLTLWDAYVKKNGVVVIDNFDVPLDNYFTHYEWLPPSIRGTPPGTFSTPPWTIPMPPTMLPGSHP